MTVAVEITRSNVTRVHVEITSMAHHWRVEHILWLAREIEKARESVDLPNSAEVKIHDQKMVIDHRITQEIP